MKSKKIFNVFLSFVLAFSIAVPNNSFASSNLDYTNHWAKESISKAMQKGYISGYGDGEFKPNAKITRAEFVSIINRAFDFSEKTDIQFDDVSDDAWYKEAVSIAYKAGYIKGTSNSSFSPNDTLTREQACVILAKISNYSLENSTTNFTDSESISAWAKTSVSACVENGIFSGNPDGSFKPSNPLTRAESVVVIENVLSKMSEKKDEKSSKVSSYENLEVSTAGTKLDNITINKNLTISEKVGQGEVTLNNIHVKGDLIVNGGGINSIYLFNATVDGSIIISKKDGKVRIVTSGNSNVSSIVFKNGGIVVVKDGNVKEIKIDKDFNQNQSIEIIGNTPNIINETNKNITITQKGETKNIKPKESNKSNSASGGSSGGGSSGGSSGGDSGGNSGQENANPSNVDITMSPENNSKNISINVNEITLKFNTELYYKAKDEKNNLNVTTTNALELNKDYIRENIVEIDEETIDKIIEGQSLYNFIETPDFKNVEYDYSDFKSNKIVKIKINDPTPLEYNTNYSIVFDPKDIIVGDNNKTLIKNTLKFTTETDPNNIPNVSDFGIYIEKGPQIEALNINKGDSVNLELKEKDTILPIEHVTYTIEDKNIVNITTDTMIKIHALNKGNTDVFIKYGSQEKKLQVTVTDNIDMDGAPKFLPGYPNIGLNENNKYIINVKTDKPAKIYVVGGFGEDGTSSDDVIRGYRNGKVTNINYYIETIANKEFTIITRRSPEYNSSEISFNIVAKDKLDNSKYSSIKSIIISNDKTLYADETSPKPIKYYLNESKDRVAISFSESLDENSIPSESEFNLSSGNIDKVFVKNSFGKRNDEFFNYSVIVLELKEPVSSNINLSYSGNSIQDMSINKNKTQPFSATTEQLDTKPILAAKNEYNTVYLYFNNYLDAFERREDDIKGHPYFNTEYFPNSLTYYIERGYISYMIKNVININSINYTHSKAGKVEDLKNLENEILLVDNAFDYVKPFDIPIEKYYGNNSVKRAYLENDYIILEFEQYIENSPVIGDSFDIFLDGQLVERFFIRAHPLNYLNKRSVTKKLRIHIDDDYFNYYNTEKSLSSANKIIVKYKPKHNEGLEVFIKDAAINKIKPFEIEVTK